MDWKPGYDLTFHCRMNLLLNDAAEGTDPEKLSLGIESLLKDPKIKIFKVNCIMPWIDQFKRTIKT